MNEPRIFQLKFEDVRPPEMTENKRTGYVSYGKKNEYPLYLLDLARQSAKHNAIIRGKVDFTIGGGVTVSDPILNDDGQPKTYKIIKEANADGESLSEVTRKLSFDIEVFGGAYAELIFDRGGRVKYINHLDFTKVRAKKDLSMFAYAPGGWAEKTSSGEYSEINKTKFEEIPAYDANSKEQKKAIVFIREYTPGMDTYPVPGYVGALRYIQTDIAISEFHLNGITNGMFGSKLISFNDGVPTLDDKKEIERKVNDKFTGPKNAGKIMISFTKNGDNGPTVVDLSGTELDKHFDVLNKTVQQEIFSGHRITSPMLFGIKTEGQLGGRSELREAFELFQSTYLNAKRELIEKYLNAILPAAGVPKIVMQRPEPIAHEFDAATMADNMTEDEIREKMGLKPREENNALKGTNKIIKKLSALPALVANKVLDMLTPNEVRAIIGLPSLPGGDNVEGQTDGPQPLQEAQGDTFDAELDDDKDSEIFAEFGRARGEVSIYESRRILYKDSLQEANGYFAEVKGLSEAKLQVLDLLTKDSGMNAKAIAQALDITPGRAAAILADLTEAGLISVKETGDGEDKQIERTPSKDARDIIGKDGGDKTSLKVMYSYEGPKDAKNRPFCAKVLELDRLYSRQDIEEISARVGYSVWNRRGGWYKPKGASEARPFCRHSWFANIIIEKKK